jgi:hypothetical protein
VVYNNTTYTVIGIGDGAFFSADDLTGSLTLANTITTIEASAFHLCKNLSGQLVLPDSLTSLGQYAFYQCNFTGELVLPSNPSFTAINPNTFSYCSFSSIIIPDNITQLNFFCFSDNSTITSITIPSTVSLIGMYSFGFMTNCTSIICDYATEPAQPEVDFKSGFFIGGSSIGTVQNTNPAYSSDDLLAFLKTKGLPDG